MTFQPGDDGHFYLTPEQREGRREDKLVPDETVKKKIKKEELMKHLHEIGIKAAGTLKNGKNFADNTTYQWKSLNRRLWRAGRGNKKG